MPRLLHPHKAEDGVRLDAQYELNTRRFAPEVAELP
jgi:hypothetical protein